MFGADDFCDGEIHERPVILGNGEEKIVWFRQLPNTDWKRYFMWLQSEDEDVRLSAEARLVAMGVCNPDGSPGLALEDAQRLKIPVLGRLITALREVNGQLSPAETGDDSGNV